MINEVDIRILILVVMRFTAFLLTSSIFFPKGVHNLFKIFVSLVISFIIFPIVSTNVSFKYNNEVEYLFIIIIEVVVGIIIGIFINLLFKLFSAMGSILDSQGGFSSASLFDPTTDSNASIIERIFYWIGLSVFILLNGHHYFIKAFIYSYQSMKIGDLYFNENFMDVFINAFLTIFKSSLMIIFPIIVILIFIDIILGIISKIIPKINMIIVSFPFKIAATIFLIIISVSMIFKRFTNIYIDFNDLIFKTFLACPVLMVFSDEKTEEPTPQKIKKTREEGNVAKSAFLVSAISILGVIIFLFIGKYVVSDIKNLTIYFLRDGLSYNYGAYDVVDIFKLIVSKSLIIIVIISSIFLVLAVISNVIQTGFLFTTKSLKPSFNALNPINNIKNLFTGKIFFDLFRDIIVVIVLCYFSYEFLRDNIQGFFRISNFRVNYLFESIIPLFTSVFFKIFMVVLLLGIFDFVLEKFKHKKKLKMTKQEVKEEFKQMEGNQEVKAQIRQKGKQIIMQNMMSNVKDSSVIITNPTHISVALRYKRGEDSAPVLLAKGVEHVAFRIKEIGRDNDIPIIENKYLARFIYKNVELNEEIPEEIYKMVADILTYIFKLNNR